MSKLTEWLNLIPSGIANLPKVIDAISTQVALEHGTLPEDQQQEIARRRLICAGCPYMSENAKTSEEYLKVAKKPYETKRDDEHCAFCGCGIALRTSGLSSDCGIETYNKKNKKAPLPLKWESYL